MSTNSCEKSVSPSIFFQRNPIFSARSSLAEQTTPVPWTWKRWWKMIGLRSSLKNPEEKDSSVVSPRNIYTPEKLRWIKTMLVWKKVLNKAFLFKYGYFLVSIRQISRVFMRQKVPDFLHFIATIFFLQKKTWEKHPSSLLPSIFDLQAFISFAQAAALFQVHGSGQWGLMPTNGCFQK